MNDQNQQQPGQAQSGTTPNSQNPGAETSLANAGQNKPFNPWEGTPDQTDEGQTAGEGATTQQSTDSTTQGAQTASQGTQGQQATGTTTTQQAPVTQGLSAADISDLVAKTVGATVAANQPKPPAQQFTEEDFRRTFQVFEPTPEILASVGLPATPESAAAFGKITAAIVRQAVTMSAYQLEKLKQDLTEHVKGAVAPYEPARQMAQERIETKLKEEFLAKNEDLKGFEPLLEEVKDRYISQGTKFKTKEEAFKAIGDSARAIIKQLPGVGQASGQSGQQQQSTNTTTGASNGHRMSGLSGSGQGGVGTSKGGAGTAKKKSTAEQLFG